ncbi:hypothetical protein [Neobacillus thermocopriae]|uniref:Uncharacterized protein n=1 Tax=Neobacillus thermocopriae TaxID=1215031 RepID=A0A6B3TRG1_9BACI|nr:hypothetical protein [Neobacillus thermocopriae]MED3622914.1 hypothetical protein [Neobacillus thermocopriae]MED3713188.1 hypothetical protein [Neobacillus thermocopriae]NEX79212.1 hypothetical protein [Neobacillus thermocopriae]
MDKLIKISDLFWEGISLSRVSNKNIVRFYLVFVIMAFLFEVFLMVLWLGTSIWSYSFGYRPSFEFYIAFGVLIIMMIITVHCIWSIFSSKNN